MTVRGEMKVNETLRVGQLKLLMSQSKCLRRKVGALIVSSDDVLLSEGYNGMFRGGKNTCGETEGECAREQLHVKSGCQTEVGCVHAEMNAILCCARLGRSTVGATLFSSLEPCMACAKMIIAAGIVRVYILEQLKTGGQELLKEYGVDVRLQKTCS